MKKPVTGKWRVQVGTGKSAYRTKYEFPDTPEGVDRAIWHYNCLNTHSGHKKRLVNPQGQITDRLIT